MIEIIFSILTIFMLTPFVYKFVGYMMYKWKEMFDAIEESLK